MESMNNMWELDIGSMDKLVMPFGANSKKSVDESTRNNKLDPSKAVANVQNKKGVPSNNPILPADANAHKLDSQLGAFQSQIIQQTMKINETPQMLSKNLLDNLKEGGSTCHEQSKELVGHAHWKSALKKELKNYNFEELSKMFKNESIGNRDFNSEVLSLINKRMMEVISTEGNETPQKVVKEFFMILSSGNKDAAATQSQKLANLPDWQGHLTIELNKHSYEDLNTKFSEEIIEHPKFNINVLGLISENMSHRLPPPPPTK